TLEAIAREKAGIFKAGRPAVIGERDPHIRGLLADCARQAGASSVRVVADEIILRRVRGDDDGTSCDLGWRGERATVRTPLAGEHQAANLAFSLVTLDAAGEEYAASLESARRQIDRVFIPGRFQHLGRYIFDVAHNPAGAEVVARTVAAVGPPAPVAGGLFVLPGKGWRGDVPRFGPGASPFLLAEAPTASARPP